MQRSTNQTNKWTEHEHITAPVPSQAQQLLNQAGSPELARHALDEAARDMAISPSYVDGLAERWGFDSRHELLAASISVAASRGELWWLTPLEGRGWIAWNERDQSMSDILPSLETARQHVSHR